MSRTAVLLACLALVDPAFGQAEPTLTVEGQGSATRAGVGNFSVTLPDGMVCTAAFSGGKISLFGRSAARAANATCTNGGTTQIARAVVSRRLNGSPEQAMLTFRDGTKVLVLFPRAEKPAPSTPPVTPPPTAPPPP